MAFREKRIFIAAFLAAIPITIGLMAAIGAAFLWLGANGYL